jgi:hypothetical protein
MCVVGETTEFYYRKGGNGLQMWSLPGGIEGPHAGKKEGQVSSEVIFISSLMWRGREPTSLPIANGLQARGSIWGTHATPVLIFRYSKSMREEISTLI